jgi:hypothetical protein
MKIFDLVENFEDDLDEARRNNYGREISNQQGQALGKQLAAKPNPNDAVGQQNLANAQASKAQAKATQATNKTDAGGDTLGQTTPQQRLADPATKAKLKAMPPRNDKNFRNKPLPDAPEGEPAPSGDATPGVGNAQGDNNAANTNVKPEKKPTDWKGVWDTTKKVAGGVKNATVGALSGAGDIASAGMDAAGRTLGSAKAGYAYGRRGELPAGHRDAEGNAITPGQRTGTLRTSSDQAQAPQGQDGGAQGQPQGGGALSNFAQNGLFGGNKQGGGQQGGGAAPVNFNAVMKAIPKFTPKQKAAIAKAVGAPAQAAPAAPSAPPAPKVVDGGKAPAPKPAVAEGFHSKFLGMMI